TLVSRREDPDRLAVRDGPPIRSLGRPRIHSRRLPTRSRTPGTYRQLNAPSGRGVAPREASYLPIRGSTPRRSSNGKTPGVAAPSVAKRGFLRELYSGRRR